MRVSSGLGSIRPNSSYGIAMNSPSASAKRVPATMCFAVDPQLAAVTHSQPCTKLEADGQRGRREVAHGQPAGVRGRLKHRQHETHDIVEHRGDDPTVGAARSTLERCTERHLRYCIIAIAMAGDGHPHRVRRTRNDTVGVVLHAVTVERRHLEQPPLHVVDRT